MDRVRQIQGQSYGQRRPSLTAVLRRILEGYPDGGQILKELIQNADDAGATEVKFLFDSRENAYGSSSLLHQELSRFQGPALYVYNNGLFRDKDWHGIEGIMQGNKRLDPLSAGRFGVGFNSVYHITDFPSVISDHYIAFLDPQETFFGAGETGRRFDLQEPLLSRYHDQFSPYEDVLSCKISSGYFGGTLFRLPLRKWPSRVSVKPYTASKVKMLFESFIAEAPLILLFLKSIESISIYETTWNENEKVIFSVSIQDDLKASIREMKEKFLQIALKPFGSPYEMSYEVIVEENRVGKYKREHKYMVLNRLGSENAKFGELSKHLHLLPWAGIAASLDSVQKKKQTTGRLFSFLPLPPESDCRTGLSVHIHGTFGVTDNRRNLKWPGSECQNDDTAVWNNLLLQEVISKAYANLIVTLTQSQYPVSEILPVVSSILPDLDRIQGHWKQLLEPFFKQLADKAVFWTEAEGGKWIALQDAVLNRLPRSTAKTRPEVRAAVLKSLLYANQPIVSLPEHALQAVDEYLVRHVPNIREITPRYVRSVLKGNSAMFTAIRNGIGAKPEIRRTPLSEHDNRNMNIYQMDKKGIQSPIKEDVVVGSLVKKPHLPFTWSALDRSEKISLLEFLMKDGDISGLEGLPLLPLADKSFAIFRPNALATNPEATVFVASRIHPMTLVPGSAHRFLDEDISEGMSDALKAVAVNGEKQNTTIVASTQLVLLAPFLVPQLLRGALLEQWRCPSVIVPWDPKGNDAPESWLKNLWSWLRTEFSTDLSPFEGVPLIPLATGRAEAKHLIKLKKNHSVVQGSSHFASLPRNLSGSLQRAGCIVLSHIPVFCDHQDLRQYLEPPTPSGVIKVLASILENEGVTPIANCSPDEKRAIRAFLSSLRNPSDDEVVTLMSLPIFEALDGTFTCIQPDDTLSGRKLDVAPPRLSLPGDIVIPHSDHIISAADDDSYQLLRRLPVRILSMSDFLVEKVFPFVEGGGFYTRIEVTVLMTWVLQRLPVLSSDNRSFPEHLKTLRFVPVANGELQAPCELFDPEDDTLRKLFVGEPTVFPSHEFSSSHSLSLLRVFLGLRRSRSLGGKDVLQIAKQIAIMPEEKGSKRALALLNFLNDNSSLLEAKVTSGEPGINAKVQLSQALSNLRWIPVSKEPPNKYPSTMPWFTSSQTLCCSSGIRDVEVANLVGATMPIIQGSIDHKLKKAFGWDFPPPTSFVLEQLKIASEKWKTHKKRPSEVEILKFQTMIREIYDRLSSPEEVSEAVASLSDCNGGAWMWYGSGFAHPRCLAFRSTCPLDLRPYLFTISEDFRNYTEFLRSCGVQGSFGEDAVLGVLSMIRDSHRHEKKDENTVKHDLHLSREILHHLIRDGKPLSKEFRDRVFIPVQSPDGNLRLEPCEQVTYCDTEWLKRREKGDDISFVAAIVHESISTHTAQLLGVQPLSRSLALVETLGFQHTGPHEPVTTRLQNVIKEYKDGVSVFKELIQNAEDAGASEVKFLIDWRQHPRERLLSPGMSEAQGPALWAYNDAVFTDNDFENINKLAGATKIESVNKIGRFGLGFCSVYNITDIPSFVSREFLVIFDPQTNHLGNLIKDTSRPGIRLNLKKSPKAIMAFSDQFVPYHKIFGCGLSEPGEDFFYDGTLFRFPLRTAKQAQTSEISNKYYDEHSFASLVTAFRENASSLVLFLSHVKKISFFEIKSDNTKDVSPDLLFELEKSTVEIISRGTQRSKSDSQLVSSPVEIMDSMNNNISLSDKANHQQPQESRVISLMSSTYPCKWFNTVKTTTTNQVWLTSFSSGRQHSIDLAASEEGKLNGLVSQAGVAAMLSSQGYGVGLWKPERVTGQAFCSLPLPLVTGLPVHVNGCFAVTTNRRGLWEDTGADHGSAKPFEVLWNKVLLEDAASSAYVKLLEDLVQLYKEGKTEDFFFETLWPNPNTTPSKLWHHFVNRVYQRISDSQAPLLRGSTRWISSCEAVYLDENVLKLPGSQEIMRECGYQVVDLPLFASRAFVKAGLNQRLVEQTITLNKFLQQAFFPSLDQISSEVRDQVICYILDEFLGESTNYGEILQNSCCIPSRPDGLVLVSPKQLIDPTGTAAQLFSVNENRFPFGERLLVPERLMALRKLGMVKNILSWEAICERAESVAKLAKVNKDQALQRVQSIVKYLNSNLLRLDQPTPSEKETIDKIKFLPVLNSPPGYCLPWKGAPKTPKRGIYLLSPSELYPERYTYLIGTSKPILDESIEMGCGPLSTEVLNLFGIAFRKVSLEDILFQLSSAVQCTRVKKSDTGWECMREICLVAYKYFQDKLQTPEKAAILDILKERPWIFVNSKFVASNQVAFAWTGHGDPFLYKLPEEFSIKFRDLFEACGVRDTFWADDYIEALFALQERKQGEVLTQTEFKTTKTFLDEIAEVDEDLVNAFYNHLPMPDAEQILRPVGQLVINDAPWLEVVGQAHFVHPDISTKLAHLLGAQTIRDVTLNKYSRCLGKSFGQSEQMTDRLKNILTSYPCDVGILKEILQNADDAQATEVHFVYDPRNHGTKRVLSKEWKELQGPALCIYNDRPFKERDIQGIQQLGRGSKSEDPETAGQYGVGFSAVYHITDCPSFITDGNTLCILDPHAQYAPDATRESPGRLLEPLDADFRNDFGDVLNGYLEEYFTLEGSTMFRFPLRTKSMAKKSEISQSYFEDVDVERLLKVFESEAKEAMLFLNSVRKISISRIENGSLAKKYQVTASISEECNDRLQELASQVKKSKEMLTSEIPYFGVTYMMAISDSQQRTEEWLVHQCLGAQHYSESSDVPDGRKLRLLPRAGVAACIRVQDVVGVSHGSPQSKQQTLSQSKQHHVFSLLPLPVETGLPAHVNGQFALDSSRRNLWLDEEGIGPRSEWNDFLKTEVIAPAYASLIWNSRARISGIQEGYPCSFNSELDIHFGFNWYHGLFPDPEAVHTDWKELALSVFRCLASTSRPVLPILQGQEPITYPPSCPPSPMDSSPEFGPVSAPVTCSWMPPTSDNENHFAYFSDLDDAINKLLLSAGFPLVYSSFKLYRDFKAAGVAAKSVNPEIVLNFLKSPRCKLGALPCLIKNSKLQDSASLAVLIDYCMKCTNIVSRLHGLPLLLTEDGVIQRFDIETPVFFTSFSDLLPKQKDLFLHRDFVAFFSKRAKDTVLQTGIFKRFDTKSLEPYLVHLLPPRWFASDKPIPWDPFTSSMPSRDWLTLLWQLIQKTFLDRQSSFEGKDDYSETLKPIEDWPVLPTNVGTLVSINLGKTVLDLASRNYEEDKLVSVLRRLGCPELDFSVLPGLSISDLSQVTSPYLAKPHSTIDLVYVLDHLMKDTGLSAKLNDSEIVVLFRFLQEDVTTVYSHKSVLRGLPFFKTLNGKYVSLASYMSAHVLELPSCIPLDDIEKRMEIEGCVLLQAIPEIEPLYKALDIFLVSRSEVFVKYILPNLDALKDEDRQSVLAFIRDTLLVTTTNPNEKSVIIDTLIDTNIVPDKTGGLGPASKYHDPENDVFKAMLSEDNFPPGDFRDEEWLPLLRQIGLKRTVTQQDFIEFAECIASDAEMNPNDPILKEKSKALVVCLLQEETLHDTCFLHLISQIKFVSAEVASENLRSLYPQFECKTKDDTPLFTAFHGSISHECQKFLWSSVPLLPSWALPKSGENQRTLVESLAIEVAPQLDKVIKHLENLSLKFAANVNKDTPKDQRELLHDVIYGILSFFKTETSCHHSDPSDQCSKSCLAIGNILRKTPCIPVEEGRVFVEGNQLAFETSLEMPPFLYKVPREYGHFEHVLKRLGAEEKPTPIQFAKVLERIKEVCEDKHMEPNEQRVARMAAQGFFTTVSVLVKEQRESSVTTLLSRITELYLPSKESFLKLSNELIFYDCPSFERRARDFSGDFVDIAREGELTADRLAYLLNLLPTRLRAKTIQSILREEIHPCCREKQCIADSEGDQCPFITRYRNIVLSPKLINGILRVIRHQRQTPNIPQEVRDQVHVLSTLNISCMGALDTHLVQLETSSSIKNSKEAQDCFLEEHEHQWELFIRHGTDENPLHIQLCFLINRLIGNHIEKEIYLQAMLACRVPEDILPSLDRCGVAQDLLSSEIRTTDPVLGSEIPVLYHYLLKQDLEYFFRQGEIVGYERERILEDGTVDNREPLYVYAKVERKTTNNSSQAETGKFDFQARYRIDIGEPKLVEVSVLDLYKFDRFGVDPTVGPVLSDLRDVVPFSGDPEESERRASSKNARMETAMKQVKETLWEAWKLQESERRKVIKRLFLRWHPDKNPGCDIASEVMKFLLSEIDRLERIFPSNWRGQHNEKKETPQEPAPTFNDLFEQWNQRARQERQTYNTFKRQNTQNSSSSSTGNPQLKEAQRWMKQAREDLTAARHLIEQEPHFYGLVCFLCQQAAEKAFKSALYAACGIAESQLETHDVLNLAYEITELDNSPADIPLLAAKLKNYYEKTRYPHYHHGGLIPSEAFTNENAQEAVEVAESILDKIGEFINGTFAKV